MRGLVFPSNKAVIDWRYAARECLGIENPNVFREKLIMGDTPNVYAHLIIPTSFGILLNDHRDMVMGMTWAKESPPDANLDVLFKQDDQFCKCVICFKKLCPDAKRPYQVAVCIMGGIVDSNTSDWKYDFVFGLFCRSCRTRYFLGLLIISEADYLTFASLLAEYAFAEKIKIEKFVKDPGVDGLLMGICDSYLWRFDLLNKHAITVIHFLQMDEADRRSCAHCQRMTTDLRALSLCLDCKTVTFCIKCYDEAMVYHHSLCDAIRKEELFDTAHAYCIARDGSGECIPLF